MPDLNYYNVLGVSRDADLMEIRRAYVRQLKFSHPDLAQSVAKPHVRLEDLQRAYRCLRQTETRQAHDDRLSSDETAHMKRLRRVQRRLDSRQRAPTRQVGAGHGRGRGRGRVANPAATRVRLALFAAAVIVILRFAAHPG